MTYKAYCTWEGTRTLTLSLTPDFESGASTNSATQAIVYRLEI